MSAPSEGRGPAAAPWQYAVASQGAGALSTLLFYPLDVVKTRFMAQDGTELRRHNGMRYQHVVPSVRTMVREEGVGSLFRGAHVAVGASALSWGAYMLVYRSLEETVIASEWRERFQQRLGVATICGLVAGATVSFATNPLWLVKARMQLANPQEHAHYSSFGRATLHIIRTDGPRSLWRGTSAQILTGVPNSLQYPLYDAIKRALVRHRARRAAASSTSQATDEAQAAAAVKMDTALNFAELTFCTVASKFCLAVASHPLQLLKARLMDHHSRVGDVQYRSLPAALVTTVRREGFSGLYRGFHVGLLHTVPRNVAQFALYEVFMRYAFGCHA